MRTTVDSISKVGRSTQGVHVMNVSQGDRVAGLATIDLSKTPAAAELEALAAAEEEKPAPRRRARAKADEAPADDAPEAKTNGRGARGSNGSNGGRNGKK